MENQTTKLDKTAKISIMAGALIVGLSVAYYLVVYIPQKDKAKIEQQNQQAQQIKEETTKKAEEERLAEAKKEPSTRALVAAAYAFYNGNEKDRDNFIKIFGEESDDTSVIIKNFAIVLDSDPIKLIEIETINDKIRRSMGESETYASPTPSSSSTSGTNSSYYDEYRQKQQQQCQEDINEYNACMSESNAKMAEYNTCIGESSNPSSYKYGRSCFKPFTRHCFKPVCSY